MESKWMSRIGLTALVWAVAAGSGSVAGCAAERDPINRTQAGVVDKAFFLGEDLEDFHDDPEFRTKSYNIDSGANTDNYAGTIGGASAVDRVRWEVTEDFLIARRSYQESPGADNRGRPRRFVDGRWQFTDKPNGTIIAAFRIDSHFDIRREYNPMTGEQMNVVGENTTDRPWQQRQYMRVDWSKNEVVSTSGDIGWVFGEGVRATALEYAATNETDEDRPHFEPDTGYFDVTAKYQVHPESSPMFGISECVILGFFNGSSSFDCTPTEAKMRHSFVRLTGDEDFEPFEESKAFRDIVGNWGNAGSSYMREYGAPPTTKWDPQYGYHDANTKTFYSFHNIWEKSHQDATCGNTKDQWGNPVNLDEDGDGTADECANEKTGYTGSRGSQCDVNIDNQGSTPRCTIPVRDREVKTIGFWLNAETPPELTDTVSSDGKTVEKLGVAEELTETWNQLLKVSVATRREVECRRTHDGSREQCHTRYFEGQGPQADVKDMVLFGGWGISRTKPLEVDKGKPVMTTCHNPVREYDLPICGKPGEKIRLGDLRKNYVIYWPYASRAPYGGVGTIGADPLTGEMLGVTATTMLRSSMAAAAQQRDIIQIAMGDLTVEELIEGVQATRYASLVKDGRVAAEHNKKWTKEEIASTVKNVQRDKVLAATTGDTTAHLDSMTAKQRQLEKALYKRELAPQSASMVADNQRLDALLGKLNSSEFRAETNRTLNRLVSQSMNKSTDVFNSISTFASADPARIQDVLDQYNEFLSRKGVCFHEATNAAGSGSIYQGSLAPYFAALYGQGGEEGEIRARGEKIYQDLHREAVKGISFHEIGHAIGMRHNFSSSWDSLNYLPQYWQLRTNEGRSTAACTEPRAGGADSCMGPRYLDPPTDDELGIAGEPRPGIEYFANTSTMEYQIERFGETAGAGTYDLHFMKTVYGRVLETFDADIVPANEQQYFAVKMLSQGIPDDLVFDPNAGYGLHYTRMAVQAKVFDPERDCREATPAEMAQAKWRIVHGKVCAPPTKNHLAYEDMQSSVIEFDVEGQVIPIGVDGVRWTGRNYELNEDGTDFAKLVRWPYRYGEDYSRGGYLHAKMMDSGADLYEITTNVVKRFDLTYPWQYFRRQNKEFAWWAVPYSVSGSVFSRIRGYHWNSTVDISRASAADLDNDNQARPSVLAAAEMFNFLQRAIMMPEPGDYGPGAGTASRTPTRPGAVTIFDLVPNDQARVVSSVGIVDARYIQVDFDNALGGSWDYNAFPHHTGYDEEKVFAIRELVDARPTLSTVSRDNALDGRDPYISFRTDTPHALDRLIGSILSEDWETIAPSAVSADGQLAGFSVLNPNAALLARPTGANVLFPNIGYSTQIGSAIYTMLYSRLSTDMTLAIKMRIALENDLGPDVPDARKMAFTDPLTGYRYIATRFGTENIGGREVETGIGSRMLQRANELMSRYYQTGAENAFGEPTVSMVNGAPVVRGTAADEKTFRRYVGLIDSMRQLYIILGNGPF